MPTVDPQISMYEKEVKNDALEDALEKRQTLRERRLKLNKDFRDADAVAKGLLEGLELGNGSVIRVGRFLVSQKAVPSREVSFTTDPSARLQISLLPE